MEDTIDPIISFIKGERAKGLDDLEIEQEILVGNWSDKDRETGRNFLHFTKKAPELNMPGDTLEKQVLGRESFMRKQRRVLSFFSSRVAPVIIAIIVCYVAYVVYERFTNPPHQRQIIVSPASSSSGAPSPATPQSSSSRPGTKPSPTPGMPQVDAGARAHSAVVCPEDIRICPSGKAVLRVPPTCDFAPCIQ